MNIESLEHDINIDFEENLSHQEVVISKIYQRPDRSCYFPGTTWIAQSNGYRQIIATGFPKQADRDKVLKIIHRKVLKGTDLPMTAKTQVDISSAHNLDTALSCAE